MAKRREDADVPSAEDVRKYQMLSGLLGSLVAEARELSKKKPDEPLNELKVRMINRVLEQVKALLDKQPTIEYLDMLDDETLPSNSDAVLILGQFTAAMKGFKERYYGYRSGQGHGWRTREGFRRVDQDDDLFDL